MKIDDEDRQYVETLLIGDVPVKGVDDLFEYGYALQKIVKYLFGNSKDVPEFDSLHSVDFIGPLDWICTSGSPIKLPFYEDVPIVGYRTINEMKSTLANWEDEMYDDFDSDTQNLIESMLSIFQIATKKKKDLITFYY
ncbi:MAG: hypothetical protein LBK06_03730 [Planctomycetaceae bacterium]|nr:hypothetical protein [Planctomycetaceae bacterium]